MTSPDNKSKSVPIEEVYKTSENPVLRDIALRILATNKEDFRTRTLSTISSFSGSGVLATGIWGMTHQLSREGNVEISSVLSTILGVFSAYLGFTGLLSLGAIRAEATSLRTVLLTEAIAESKQN